MIRDGVLSLVLSPTSHLAAEKSRCLRMRYNRSSCARCMAICPRGAISIEGGISLDGGKCTGCMLCASACPVDAVEASGFDFGTVVVELSRAERPLLGCTHKEELRSHAKTPCLGFLTVEHLVFLLSFLDGPVQLNLTECGECENGPVLESLFDVIASIEKTVPGMAPRLKAITGKGELEFQEVSLSRRDFFRLLRGSAMEGVSGAVEQLYQRQKSQSYGSKKIPGKRELLNVSYRRGGSGAEGLRALYFNMDVDSCCNACGACVAICPNGAFKSTRGDEAKTLSFNASRCSGCGLCVEFCRHDALKLRGGHEGSGLMEFVSVRAIPSVNVEQGNGHNSPIRVA